MRRPVRFERGSAVVEFALSFSLLWLVLSGLFQWGYAIYTYNGLAAAVAQGARAAAQAKLVSGSTSTFTNYVKNIVVYGNPDGTGSPAVPGLTTANVQVTWTPNSPSTPPNTVTVAVNGYTIHAMFRNIALRSKPQVTMRYVGNFNVP